MNQNSNTTENMQQQPHPAGFVDPNLMMRRASVRGTIVMASIMGLLSFLIITYIIAFFMSIVIMIRSSEVGPDKSGSVLASGLLIMLLPFIGSIVALVITSDLNRPPMAMY